MQIVSDWLSDVVGLSTKFQANVLASIVVVKLLWTLRKIILAALSALQRTFEFITAGVK